MFGPDENLTWRKLSAGPLKTYFRGISSMLNPNLFSYLNYLQFFSHSEKNLGKVLGKRGVRAYCSASVAMIFSGLEKKGTLGGG